MAASPPIHSLMVFSERQLEQRFRVTEVRRSGVHWTALANQLPAARTMIAAAESSRVLAGPIGCKSREG